MKKITQESSTLVVGICLRTSNKEAPQTIPPFWQKFFEEKILTNIPNKVSDKIYAVYTDFENEGLNNDGTYSLIIGAEVSDIENIPDGLTSTVIKPSKRAVFEVKGRNSFEKWIEIWQMSDLQKTFVSDYELYRPSGDIEIYVGIQ